MNILAIIGTCVGTFAFACLFDHGFEKIFNGKKKEHTIKDLNDLVKKI